MIIDTRKKTSVETYFVYVAKDGTEFLDSRQCEKYENELAIKERNIRCKKAENLNGHGGVLWYLKSQEDFDCLKKTAWLHTKTEGQFSKPGWYISSFISSYDDWDSTEVEYLKDYLDEYEKRIAELRRLTSEEEQ